MNKAFIVTGTPGTGKTTFAKQFAKENKLIYIDGKKIISEYGLSEEFDTENKSYIVDERKFAKVCEKLIKESEIQIVIDSHLSQFISPKYVEKCFVTTCDISLLKIRLMKRKYSSQKIRDNLDAEIFLECKLEAEELGHLVEVVKTE